MTGKQTPTVDESGIPLMPEDHPFYKRGWIVGQSVSGVSPRAAAARSEAPTSSDPRETLAQMEPKRENFQDEESYLEALDGFKHRVKHTMAVRRSKAPPQK
jgi:hypothetical protein